MLRVWCPYQLSSSRGFMASGICLSTSQGDRLDGNMVERLKRHASLLYNEMPLWDLTQVPLLRTGLRAVSSTTVRIPSALHLLEVLYLYLTHMRTMFSIDELGRPHSNHNDDAEFRIYININ